MTVSTDPIEPIRAASRQLVRELGFMRHTLAGTALAPSSVHTLVEISVRGSLTASELSALLRLEKSSVSRMLRKLIALGLLCRDPAEADGRVKRLSLTGRGQASVAAIHDFARRQVVAAMKRLSPAEQKTVRNGLDLYAQALGADAARGTADPAPILIERGYHSGLFARCIAMHACYYGREWGLGRAFETAVAGGIAEFGGRLDRPDNGFWRASRDGRIVGTVAIDGEDMGPGVAHLRWFIVDDASRAGGIGSRLLREALAFCDGRGFAETQLWTFRGLDAARRLYERNGFALAEERIGTQWGKEVMEQRFARPGPALTKRPPRR